VSKVRVQATVTIEFDLYRFALTDNITAGEISDAIHYRVAQAGGSKLITHAAWGEVGKPWTAEWRNGEPAQ
jgi:hypothetical protein